MLMQRVRRPDGKERILTQKLQVTNSQVLSRLCADVCCGDEIEAIIVTDWTKSGHASHLADFCSVTPVSLSDTVEQPVPSKIAS